MSESERERKDKRIAMLTTAGVNVLVLLMLLFIVAWREPNPPHPETGIELNFGMDTQGAGAVQPEEPVSSQPAAAEKAEEQEQQEETQEPVKAPEDIKPVEQEAVSTQESPVEVKEEKAKPTEKPAEKQEEKKQQSHTEVKKDPVPDPKAVYKSSNTNKITTESHGDDKTKAGDKGSPEGQLDKNALYGKAGGGGGGPSLDLNGWEWDSRPAPKVPETEMGGVVKFRITVDENGDVIEIVPLESSVSNPETQRICKNAVEKLTFIKTGTNVPERTTGTITFVVRSK